MTNGIMRKQTKKRAGKIKSKKNKNNNLYKKPLEIILGIDYSHLTIAGVAQLVEHLIRNEGVVGSSPITGTMITIPPHSLGDFYCQTTFCFTFK